MSEEELCKRNSELKRENAEFREANNILKDALVFCKRLEEVKNCEGHIIVPNNKDKYRINAMCRVLKISKSGYYQWAKNRF